MTDHSVLIVISDSFLRADDSHSDVARFWGSGQIDVVIVARRASGRAVRASPRTSAEIHKDLRSKRVSASCAAEESKWLLAAAQSTRPSEP